MSTSNYLFYYFRNSLTGHIILVIFLVIVLNKQPLWTQIKKLPPLLVSPFVAALLLTGLNAAAPKITLLPYIVTSLAILIMCTLWMMRTQKSGFWQAFPPICMAAIFQVAISTLSGILFLLFPADTQLRYRLLTGLYFFLAFLIAFLLKRIRFGDYFQLLMEDKTNLRQTALLIFALEITMEAFLILLNGIQPEYLVMYYLLVIALVSLMTGLLVYLAKRLEASHRLQAQQDIIAQQQLYEQDLEDIRREVRSFRHDYKNLLASLSEQAGAGELDKLRQSLAKLDIDFDKRLGEKIQSTVQIGNLQIPQIRSLFLTKLTAMRDMGITCKLEVLYPVVHVSIDVWDYVRCLGILMDNAMEAAAETERPWVETMLLQQGNTLLLRIANPYRNTISPANIWDKGWSTKGAGRGLGLASYRRILEGYPHTVSSTSWRDHIFVQELTVGERP